MARLNTNAELWSHLSSLVMLSDNGAGVSTTLDAAQTSTGSTAGTAGSCAALVAGDYVRVGPRGASVYAEVESGAAGGFSAKSKFGEALSNGWDVKEQTQTDLGDISDTGVSIDLTADVTTINVATQRHAYAHHVAHTDYACTVQLENLSIENLLSAMGIPDAQMHGAGTTADPNVADWISNNIDTINPLAFVASGTMKDGTNVEVEFWDCDFNPAKTIALARGQDAPLEFTFYARMIRWKHPV